MSLRPLKGTGASGVVVDTCICVCGFDSTVVISLSSHTVLPSARRILFNWVLLLLAHDPGVPGKGHARSVLVLDF